MSWLYSAPLEVLAVAIGVASLLALEVGHRLGRRMPVSEQQVANIAGPILSVFALVLAFSFFLAAERHSLRRAAAVQETNSIGTLWLRTSLVPEPTRSEMRSHLRRYVDLHFQHRQAGIQEVQTTAIESEATALQTKLWTLLVDETRRDPAAPWVRLVTPAMNDVIDDLAMMLAARENRVPDPVLLYVLLLLVVSGVLVGYRPTSERRHPILWVLFSVVVGGMVVMLLDMDRPRRGWIQADTTPYLRLKESMREDPR